MQFGNPASLSSGLKERRANFDSRIGLPPFAIKARLCAGPLRASQSTFSYFRRTPPSPFVFANR
jgi:hypothetical protein